jgi:hypothetical protein
MRICGDGGSLAVCMMVRNEADYLRNSLHSLGGNCDVIHVTDTGSEDDSVIVALSAGAVVRRFSWEGHFGEARNASIAGVSEEWILILDADDEFPEGEAGRLRCMLVGSDPEVLAGTILYECHRDHTPMRAVRLLRNVPGLRYRGRIHEYPDFGEPLRASQVRHFPVRLVHRGEMPGDAAGNKDRRNLPLLLAEWEEVREAGDPGRRMEIGSCLAQTLMALDKADAADALLKELLQPMLAGSGQGIPAATMLRAWVRRLHVLGMKEGADAVLGAARDAEAALGNTVVYALHRGQAEIAAGCMQAALPWLESFAQRAEGVEIPVPRHCLGARLELMLASCHAAAGNRDRVAYHCGKAMEDAPEDFETRLRVRLLTGGTTNYD